MYFEDYAAVLYVRFKVHYIKDIKISKICSARCTDFVYITSDIVFVN